MPKLNDTIKEIAVLAVNDSKPVNVVYGTVIRTAPLSVSVSKKLSLSSSQLIGLSGLFDREVEMEIEGQKKIVKVKSGLKSGDTVVLLRVQGGQKYVVLDKVV